MFRLRQCYRKINDSFSKCTRFIFSLGPPGCFSGEYTKFPRHYFCNLKPCALGPDATTVILIYQPATQGNAVKTFESLNPLFTSAPVNAPFCTCRNHLNCTMMTYTVLPINWVINHVYIYILTAVS